jgi:hypothetical protein
MFINVTILMIISEGYTLRFFSLASFLHLRVIRFFYNQMFSTAPSSLSLSLRNRVMIDINEQVKYTCTFMYFNNYVHI